MKSSAGESTTTLSESKSLSQLLEESDLIAYLPMLNAKLKVFTIEHLKFVTEEDLIGIGMSKPELRRLKSSFELLQPAQSVFGRLKTKLTRIGSTKKSSDCPSSSTGADKMAKNSGAQAATDQHIIPANLITLCKELGQGEFGKVYQGVWSHSSTEKVQIAVKAVLHEKLQSNPLDFLQEAAIMHKLNHTNVVRLYGVVLETKTVMLVSELAPLRSLLEVLRQSALRPSFPILTLCSYAEQICSGMAYLEANRFIHRDLAARNILVFGADLVKISDFGLSRALGLGEEYYRSNFSVNLKLPIAWCAPEAINYLKFTHASDVWAFGVTLWEIFTYGFQPWLGLTGQQILDAVSSPKCQRLEPPDSCPSDYYGLMLQCWENTAESRPKFADILTVLPEIKPERVQTISDCLDGQLDHLQCKKGEIITVLNKRPKEYPDGYYWRGILNSSRTGLFLPTNTITYLGSECPITHPLSMAAPLRASFNKGKPSRLARSMIGAPENDFRHTGHVGLDGSHFGDVKKLVTKADLPRQIVAPMKSAGTNESSIDTRLTSIGSESTDHADLGHFLDLDSAEPSENFSTGLSLLDEVFDMLSCTGSNVLNLDANCIEQSTTVAEENKTDSKSPAKREFFGQNFNSTGLIADWSEPSTPHVIDTNDTDPLIRNRPNSQVDSAPKSAKKSALIKPMSSSDSRLIDEIVNLAQKSAAESLVEAKTADQTELLPLGKRMSKNLAKIGRTEPEKKSFSEELENAKPIDSLIDTNAEEVYKALVLQQSSQIVTETPSQPDSARSATANEVESDVEEDENPLRKLRNSGGIGIVRSFRQGSGRNINFKIPPPVKPKFPHSNENEIVPAATKTPHKGPPVPPKPTHRNVVESQILQNSSSFRDLILDFDEIINL